VALVEQLASYNLNLVLKRAIAPSGIASYLQHEIIVAGIFCIHEGLLKKISG
jgi:hypothetical protein